MKKREYNTYQMFTTVIGANKKASETIKNAIPGYNTLFQKVEQNHALIGTKNGKQGTSRKGLALEKNHTKTQLVKHTMVFVHCIKAHAFDTKNIVLLEEMKAFSKSGLQKKRDITLPSFTEFIIKKATTLAAALQPYGITQQTLDQIQQLQTNYNKHLGATRNAIVQRTQLTKDIQNLLKQTTQLLKQIDNLVNTVELLHPNFHQHYFLNRKTINYSNTTLSLRGYILDQDKNPISNAIINIPSIRRYARTTQKGYFEFKNLPIGILNLEIKHILYNTATKAVGIVKGERKDLKTTLTKAILTEQSA